jgi:Ca2+-binding EF-hand superfamily protein
MKLNIGRCCLPLLFLVPPASSLCAQASKPAGQAPLSLYATSPWTGIDAERLLRLLDSDRDGFVTRDEWDRFFADHDDNKDGRLSPDEIQPGMSQTAKDLEPDYGRQMAFDRLDVNKDGIIEKTEWPGKERDFRLMDANHDAVLSREEFLSRNGRWWNETFDNVDLDGDGVVTRSEWLDSDSSFNRLDHDHNGVVDRQEFYNPR